MSWMPVPSPVGRGLSLHQLAATPIQSRRDDLMVAPTRQYTRYSPVGTILWLHQPAIHPPQSRRDDLMVARQYTRYSPVGTDLWLHESAAHHATVP